MFFRIIGQLVRTGSLEIIDAEGRSHRFGDGTGLPVRVRFHDSALPWTLCINPRLRLGELYMDGRLTIEDGTILDLLEMVQESNRWEDASEAKALGRRLHPHLFEFAPQLLQFFVPTINLDS